MGLSWLGPSRVDNATFPTLEFWATDLSAAFLLGIAKHPGCTWSTPHPSSLCYPQAVPGWSVHGTTGHLISQASLFGSVPSRPPSLVIASPRPSTPPSRPTLPQFCSLPRPPGLCAFVIASMESLIRPQPESPSKPKSSHAPCCPGTQTLGRDPCPCVGK